MTSFEPEWRRSADSVYATRLYILSRKNFIDLKAKEIAENKVFLQYLPEERVKKLDSLSAIVNTEALSSTVVKGTFDRVVSGTEKLDGRFEIIRAGLKQGTETGDIHKFLDTATVIADSIKVLSAKYKIQITQSHSVASNAYLGYKDIFEAEMDKLKKIAQQGGKK